MTADLGGSFDKWDWGLYISMKGTKRITIKMGQERKRYEPALSVWLTTKDQVMLTYQHRKPTAIVKRQHCSKKI